MSASFSISFEIHNNASQMDLPPRSLVNKEHSKFKGANVSLLVTQYGDIPDETRICVVDELFPFHGPLLMCMCHVA